MITNVERFVGVCATKFKSGPDEFARLIPLFSVDFSSRRKLTSLKTDDRRNKFPNDGFVFWKLSPVMPAEYDEIYEFGIKESDKHGRRDGTWDWYQVKTDNIDSLSELIDLSTKTSFDAFREELEFFCN